MHLKGLELVRKVLVMWGGLILLWVPNGHLGTVLPEGFKNTNACDICAGSFCFDNLLKTWFDDV